MTQQILESVPIESNAKVTFWRNGGASKDGLRRRDSLLLFLAVGFPALLVLRSGVTPAQDGFVASIAQLLAIDPSLVASMVMALTMLLLALGAFVALGEPQVTEERESLEGPGIDSAASAPERQRFPEAILLAIALPSWIIYASAYPLLGLGLAALALGLCLILRGVKRVRLTGMLFFAAIGGAMIAVLSRVDGPAVGEPLPRLLHSAFFALLLLGIVSVGHGVIWRRHSRVAGLQRAAGILALTLGPVALVLVGAGGLFLLVPFLALGGGAMLARVPVFPRLVVLSFFLISALVTLGRLW